MAFDKLNPNQRSRFHAMFERWLCNATDQEYQEFANLRELIAPGQVCTEPPRLSRRPVGLSQVTTMET